MPKARNILIAEDEKAISKALRDKLVKAGFVVTTAMNGYEAIEYLKSNHFDLVILDLIMPRVDGFRTLELMEEGGIKVKVMVLSNLAQAKDIERVRSLGAIKYFVKANTTLAEIVEYINNNI